MRRLDGLSSERDGYDGPVTERAAAGQSGSRPQPCRDPHDHPRRPARHVPGGARPDHHRDGIADHRPRARRPRAPALDRDGLSSDLHRRDAALRQVQRFLRPARHHAGRHCDLHRRIHRLRAGADHARPHPGPRPAGRRRRRPDRARADDHRRHRRAAGARTLPGLFRQRLHDLEPARPGAGRLLRRAPALVGDLLDQHSPRPRRLGHRLSQPEEAAAPRPSASARPARRGSSRGGHRRSASGPELGRDPLSLGVPAGARAVCRLARCSGGFSPCACAWRPSR